MSEESTSGRSRRTAVTFNVDHRVAGEDPFLHTVADTLLDGGDEVTRDGAAEDIFDELEPPPRGIGSTRKPGVSVLATARARLLLVLACPRPGPFTVSLVRGYAGA